MIGFIFKSMTATTVNYKQGNSLRWIVQSGREASDRKIGREIIFIVSRYALLLIAQRIATKYWPCKMSINYVTHFECSIYFMIKLFLKNFFHSCHLNDYPFAKELHGVSTHDWAHQQQQRYALVRIWATESDHFSSYMPCHLTQLDYQPSIQTPQIA